MAGFLFRYWDVIAFYTIVVILLYVFRRRFVFQGVVALLKTKLGVRFMTDLGKKHPRFWHALGLVGITLGFVGMAIITGYLVYGIYTLFFVPGSPPVLSPVIPGVKIPGVPITFPLWYTLFGLFLAVVVHEAAHGVWSSAYGIRIKSSGFAFFGPLPGAFVEPDEAVMARRPKRQQLAIMAAGPFANMALAVVAYAGALALAFAALAFVTPVGVTVGGVQDGTAAAAAGLPAGVTITAIDGTPITKLDDLTAALAQHRPGDTVAVTADGAAYAVTLGESPEQAGKAYVGITNNETALAQKRPQLAWLYDLVLILDEALIWTFIISLGIGLANLLPIGPLDGGRMFLLALQTRLAEDRAKQVWLRWSMTLFIVVLVLVFVPIIKAVL